MKNSGEKQHQISLRERKEVVIKVHKIKTVMIRGQPWEVQWKKRVGPVRGFYVGLCWNDGLNIIQVQKSQKPLDAAETVVHEMLHAEFPDASEEDVTMAATDIINALKSIGMNFGK